MEDAGFHCHAHELLAHWEVLNPTDDPIQPPLSPSDLPSKSEFQLQLLSSMDHSVEALTEGTTLLHPNLTPEPHHCTKIINVDRVYSAGELFEIISSALLESHDELQRWGGLNSMVSDIIQKVHRPILDTAGTEYCDNPVRVSVDLTLLHFCYMDRKLIQTSLAEANHGMKPASKSATKEMLKRVSFDKNQIHSDDDDETCCVCLEQLGRDYVLCMPCSHMFHASCILKWLCNSHYCPICRFQIPTEE